ncbi:MAG: sugar transferase [Kaiparowitsia implicata GSE-PSE-MK54-09C]|jgi:lipopolysaccharide/colanic/teichoic acid biosynthesis glycosyltransferase|nr:sugar transferase [Kaiparowitsia implicata GSE-PSE-MK54-09C]
MFEDLSWRQPRAKVAIDPVGHRFYELGKRVGDVVLVLLGGPFIVPVVALLAAMIMFDGGSPFYSQPRVGRHGRVFQLWKLRSMVPDADAKLAAYLDSCPEARTEWDTAQKLKRDPRLTRIGHYIRRYSLDELPQLWNVLIGDMSLVGPRPMMREQRVLYPGTAYFDLRPGLTGPWQISARNNCSFAGRAAYDNSYARSVSASTDIKILMRTVGVVLRGTGC